MNTWTWARQMFCTHRSRSWQTLPDPENESVAITRGGCVYCGKPLPISCSRCGR